MATDFSSYENINIGGTPIRRPDNFAPARENVYAGEYTTASGRRIMDYTGWRFSDMTLEWSALPAFSYKALSYLTVPAEMIFDFVDDDLGDPTTYRENVVLTLSSSRLHPYIDNEGVTWYRDVTADVSFLDIHR